MQAFRAWLLSSIWERHLHSSPSLTSRIKAHTEVHSRHSEWHVDHICTFAWKLFSHSVHYNDLDTRVRRGFNKWPVSEAFPLWILPTQCSLSPDTLIKHIPVIQHQGRVHCLTLPTSWSCDSLPFPAILKLVHFVNTLTFASSCLWIENHLLDLSFLNLCHLWFHTIWRAEI